jgi:hypothetical protein
MAIGCRWVPAARSLRAAVGGVVVADRVAGNAIALRRPVPRSTIRQRSEQNGRCGLPSQGTACGSSGSEPVWRLSTARATIGARRGGCNIIGVKRET